MSIPVKIDFHGVDHSDAVEARIAERVRRLEKFADRATGLHVTVSTPHHRRTKGAQFQFTLELALPGGEVVVRQNDDSKQAHEDVYVALRDAFDALERRAHDHLAKAKP